MPDGFRLVLREDDIFVVSLEDGDILPEVSGLGVFYRDTRFLNLFRLEVNGYRPVVLSSSAEHNYMANIQCANPAMVLADGTHVLPQTLSIRRNRFVDSGVHERIGLMNYNREPLRLSLKLTFGGDFRDIFDVRGYAKGRRGQLLPPAVEGGVVVLRYMGRDGLLRSLAINFDQPPQSVEVVRAEPEVELVPGAVEPEGLYPRMMEVHYPPTVAVNYTVVLQPHQPLAITLHLTPSEDTPQASGGFDAEVVRVRGSYDTWSEKCASFDTEDELFDKVLRRGVLDLRFLIKEFPTGPLPVAGVPWFAAPFGRDALITSLQTLMLNPGIAAGTLRFLASYQGQEVDTWRQEEPGKILHELRIGEMARLGEVPHSPYYGSVDATPLFLLLFAEVLRWTADRRFMEELLPAAKLALRWIDEYGDRDGDGFVEYQGEEGRGLFHQGWKDSRHAVLHADGTDPVHPIALAEVQGYVYAARMGMAEVFRKMGMVDEARKQEAAALELKRRFNRDFWLEEEGYFAMALDGRKRPVASIASNPAQCLFTGVVDDDRAKHMVKRLMEPDLCSGWGIRTLSFRMPHFNPMSYHNGSIWPHDNSLIVLGLCRMGFFEEASEIAWQVYQAAYRFRYFRLPELYCGFARDLRYYSVPASYPSACSPQAWAAAAPILMLQALLGLEGDAFGGVVRIRRELPVWIGGVRIRNLRLGDALFDLMVSRRGDEVRAEVLPKAGRVSLEVVD